MNCQEKIFKVGDWAYFANLPGTVKIVEYGRVWYLPNHIVYVVEFQGKYYNAYDWELE